MDVPSHDKVIEVEIEYLDFSYQPKRIRATWREILKLSVKVEEIKYDRDTSGNT